MSIFDHARLFIADRCQVGYITRSGLCLPPSRFITVNITTDTVNGERAYPFLQSFAYAAVPVYPKTDLTLDEASTGGDLLLIPIPGVEGRALPSGRLKLDTSCFKLAQFAPRRPLRLCGLRTPLFADTLTIHVSDVEYDATDPSSLRFDYDRVRRMRALLTCSLRPRECTPVATTDDGLTLGLPSPVLSRVVALATDMDPIGSFSWESVSKIVDLVNHWGGPDALIASQPLHVVDSIRPSTNGVEVETSLGMRLVLAVPGAHLNAVHKFVKMRSARRALLGQRPRAVIGRLRTVVRAWGSGEL